VRRRILFALFLLLSSAIVQPAVSAPLKVVATFSVLGDMVKQIAGERVALTTIVGADADSESYEPTAADARAVAEADLLIMNGFNPEFEPWLDGLLHQAQFHGTRIVASNGIRTLKRAEEGSTFAPSSADEYDQHAWNDAANAAVYATNIAAALLQLDRSHAEEYRKRGETYRRELFNLDAWAKQRVADIPVAKRKVITSHQRARLDNRQGANCRTGSQAYLADPGRSASDLHREHERPTPYTAHCT
jgi:zinc/manganese transport system substrate-binding protein